MRHKWCVKVFVGSIAIAIVILGIIGVAAFKPGSRRAILKLPAGNIRPVVAFGGDRGALVAPDGSLWVWGKGNNPDECDFELGIDSTNAQPALRLADNQNDWRYLSASDENTLGVKSDGTVWGWGRICPCRVAHGTAFLFRRPAQILSGNDWQQVAAGHYCYYALKKDGSLWGWGWNPFGQLGTGSTNDLGFTVKFEDATGSTNEIPLPVQIGSGTNWVKILTIDGQVGGLQSDGSLWMWGLERTFEPNWTMVLIPTRASPDTDWADFGFGFYNTFAIKSDGSLWVRGMLADLYTGARDKNLNLTFQRIGTDTDWESCSSSGGDNQIFRKKDGSFWTTDIRPYPQQKYVKAVTFKRLALPDNVVAFGSGHESIAAIGAAITDTGEVWTWGEALGQLTSPKHSLQVFAKMYTRFGRYRNWGDPKPVWREKPWLLSVVHPDATRNANMP